MLEIKIIVKEKGNTFVTKAKINLNGNQGMYIPAIGALLESIASDYAEKSDGKVPDEFIEYVAGESVKATIKSLEGKGIEVLKFKEMSKQDQLEFLIENLTNVLEARAKD